MAVYNRLYTEDLWKSVNTVNKEYMEDFLMEKRAEGKTDGTLYQYRSDCRYILCYIALNLDNVEITTLSKKDFRRLTLTLKDECEMSSARVNRILSVLRTFLLYLEDDDDVDYERSAAAKIKGLPKEAVRDIVFIPNDVVIALINKLDAEKRYEEATLAALMFESGARRNEIRQVEKYSFYDDSKNATNIVIGKEQKKFRVLYFGLTKRCAKKYLDERGEDKIPNLFVKCEAGEKVPASYEALYEFVVRWRKDLLEITGEDYNINPHSFRHSAFQCYSDGTHEALIEQGLDALPIEKIKLIARHNSAETTLSYLKDRGEEELEDLFKIKIG